MNTYRLHIPGITEEMESTGEYELQAIERLCERMNASLSKLSLTSQSGWVTTEIKVRPSDLRKPDDRKDASVPLPYSEVIEPKRAKKTTNPQVLSQTEASNFLEPISDPVQIAAWQEVDRSILRELRKRLGKSQEHFAQRLWITRNEVCELENNKNAPISKEIAAKLAAIDKMTDIQFHKLPTREINHRPEKGKRNTGIRDSGIR